MSEQEIQNIIIERSRDIARLIVSQKDCEIRPDRNKGIKVMEVRKKEV